VEDVAPSTFDVSMLKSCSFRKDGEPPISGDEVRKRAIQFRGNLGLADGKRMLAEQDKISAELQEYCISLPGTVLRDSDDYLHVPCLRFFDGHWVLDFFWLGGDWPDYVRFACSE